MKLLVKILAFIFNWALIFFWLGLTCWAIVFAYQSIVMLLRAAESVNLNELKFKRKLHDDKQYKIIEGYK